MPANYILAIVLSKKDGHCMQQKVYLVDVYCGASPFSIFVEIPRLHCFLSLIF